MDLYAYCMTVCFGYESFVVIQLLGESSSGYLVGDSATLADLELLEFLLATFDYFEEDVLQDYPHLRVCILLFKSNYTLFHYVKSIEVKYATLHAGVNHH